MIACLIPAIILFVDTRLTSETTDVNQNFIFNSLRSSSYLDRTGDMDI